MRCPICNHELNEGTLVEFNWINAFERPHPNFHFPFSTREVDKILKANVGYKCLNCMKKHDYVGTKLGWQFITLDGFWYYYLAGWKKFKRANEQEKVIFS